MSALQEQIVQKIGGLSEDNLLFLLEIIDRFMKPEKVEKALWAFNDNLKLPEQAKRLIVDEANEIYYSSASVWEITIKHMVIMRW